MERYRRRGGPVGSSGILSRIQRLLGVERIQVSRDSGLALADSIRWLICIPDVSAGVAKLGLGSHSAFAGGAARLLGRRWHGDTAGFLGAGAGSGLWLCSEGHARERSLRRRRHDGMAVRTRRRRILQHGAGVRKAGAIRHAAVGGHPIEQAAICKPLVGRPAESDVLRTVFFRRTRWAIPAHLLPASNRSIHPVDDPAAGRGESTLGVRGPALYAELEIVFAKSAGPLSSEPRHAAKRRLSNC